MSALNPAYLKNVRIKTYDSLIIIFFTAFRIEIYICICIYSIYSVYHSIAVVVPWERVSNGVPLLQR